MRNPFSNRVFIGTTGLALFLVLLAPLICFRYFPTVDGPAHLYNAAAIRDMLFSSEPFFSKFFNFNLEPVPNWTGHLFMAIAGWVLPVWMVEKLVLLLIAIGIPFGIMRLVRSFGAPIAWHWLMLLPFTYTLILYLGFFNFLLSVVLLLFLLPLLWDVHKPVKVITKVLMFILVTAVYFTHLLGFLLLGLFAFAGWLWNSRFKNDKKQLRWNIFWQVLYFVPGLVLAVFYFSGRGMEGFRQKMEVLPISEIGKLFREGAPLAGLDGEVEVPFTTLFVCLLAAITLIVIVKRIIKKEGLTLSDIFMISAIIMLALIFVMPDGVAAGGFVTLRLLLILQLMLVGWLMCQRLPWLLSLLSVAVSVCVAFGTLRYRFETARILSHDVTTVVSLANGMPEGSIVLPLNYSSNWLHINISNYIGAAKRVLILDNYEAVQGEFPLRWRVKFNPGLSAGNFTQSLNPVIDPDGYQKKCGIPITCVTRWWFIANDADTIRKSTDHQLRHSFEKLMERGEAELFSRIDRNAK